MREEYDNLKILVHDSGRGIKPEIVKSIFEKGYTTKGDKGGTGYGLWVCKKISEATGGQMKAENSTLLSGACFSFEVSLTSNHSLEKVA